MKRFQTPVKRFPICKKTGRIFDNIYEAALYFHVSHQTICNYCEKKSKERKYNIDVEWITLGEISKKMRLLIDDNNFYRNAERFKGLEKK